MLFMPKTGLRRNADLRWRSLPKAEAPTEPADETGCGQPRYRMGQVFAQPATTRQIPHFRSGKVELLVRITISF